MKNLLVSSLLVLSLPALSNGKKGDTFYVNSVKKQICSQAYKGFKREGVTESNCLKARFTFSKDKVTQKIQGTKKPLTTLMEVTFDVNGTTIESTVAAKLEVSTTGKIKRTGWTVRNVELAGMTDESILKNTWFGKYTKDISKSSMNSEILDGMIEATVESLNQTEVASGSDSEMSTNTDDIQVITNEKGKVLGFIMTGEVSSEEMDMREIYAFKFDKDGYMIDSSLEKGFGYHE